MPPARVPRELPPRLGMTLVEGGAELAVYAGQADSVEVCLFDEGDVAGASERRISLSDRVHDIWHGFLPGVGPGQRYGLRADGPWRPEQGLRHNARKLLLDPYARAIDGEVVWSPDVFAHQVDGELHGDGEIPSDIDSRSAMPRCVVTADRFDWGDDRPPRTPLVDTVLYEAHVRSLTMRHPEVPAHQRGTYAGLSHPAVVAHLQRLGVTAVELLPVHAFASEPQLAQRGLTNHWGYNTLGFFAPHAPYASVKDPQGVLDEFKGMVRRLHEAGIEVVLDVVYNHTAEQTSRGACLSWRGLDNRAYYRLDERGHDIDVTGCGNTLDLRHAMVCRMVLDSLRYWVQECHVDGFRFDLAVALARGTRDEYDANHPFLVALRTDPVLNRVKLIAEPWDVGMHGWRTGQFPPPFAEWNDRFRDTVRTFWLQDLGAEASGHAGHGVRELATRLTGSQDLFGARDRGPLASVNYVVAHDGFTLADLTRYNTKHNAANGEGNRDGSDVNHSWNHGHEGPSDDEELESGRRQSMRNLVGTTLLATGVPMICAGDELGRTQHGNNNAYCQDNEISWLDWDLEGWQEDLLATTAFLSKLRARLPVLRRSAFFTGRGRKDGSEGGVPVEDGVPVEGDIPVEGRGAGRGLPDLEWLTAEGEPMHQGLWEDPGTRTLVMVVAGDGVDEDSVVIALNGSLSPAKVTLPRLPGRPAYELLWDSSQERPEEEPGRTVEPVVEVGPASIQVFSAAAPASS